MTKPPRPRWPLLVGAFVFGVLGGMLANVVVLSGAWGNLPFGNEVLREIRQERYIEESALTETVLAAERSVLRLRTDIGADAGTALALSDDGLLLLLETAVDAADTAETRSGYALPLRRIGTDPWSGLAVAKIELTGIPAREVTAAGLAAAAPALGQRLLGAERGNGLAVAPTYVGERGAMVIDAGGPLLHSFRTFPVAGSPILFDLSGSVTAVRIGTDRALFGPSIHALLTIAQEGSAIVRPDFGFGAEPLLPRDAARVAFGARVTDVTPGGAYAAAGGTVGDIIVNVNGQDLGSDLTLPDVLSAKTGTNPVAFVVIRGTGEATLVTHPIRR